VACLLLLCTLGSIQLVSASDLPVGELIAVCVESAVPQANLAAYIALLARTLEHALHHVRSSLVLHTKRYLLVAVGPLVDAVGQIKQGVLAGIGKTTGTRGQPPLHSPPASCPCTIACICCFGSNWANSHTCPIQKTSRRPLNPFHRACTLTVHGHAECTEAWHVTACVVC